MQITNVSEKDFDEITSVWEASVKATHTFLKDEDISLYRNLIRNKYLYNLSLACVRDIYEKIAGFIGIDNSKIEMLFIRPDKRGEGLGKMLVHYAINQYHINLVDVNEQNEQAVVFYQHLGFHIIDRSNTDGEGKNYPILHMELKTLF
ncbi:MAG: GNAT family N-acetyltransferase [Bacteroidales bacterium]|nr:GNAT family N-acetyltransferase [Bacteroidales bacterium]